MEVVSGVLLEVDRIFVDTTGTCKGSWKLSQIPARVKSYREKSLPLENEAQPQ